MSITGDNSIKGTCCVCGEPLNPLLGALPPLPGTNVAHCSKCGKSACANHLKEHSKNCGKIDKAGTDWCKTPGIFS